MMSLLKSSWVRFVSKQPMLLTGITPTSHQVRIWHKVILSWGAMHKSRLMHVCFKKCFVQLAFSFWSVLGTKQWTQPCLGPGNQLNNTYLAWIPRSPQKTLMGDKPMLLMGFNQLPTELIYDKRSFYHGEPCTNQDSCMAVLKNAWSLRHSSFWGTSGTKQ